MVGVKNEKFIAPRYGYLVNREDASEDPEETYCLGLINQLMSYREKIYIQRGVCVERMEPGQMIKAPYDWVFWSDYYAKNVKGVNVKEK